MVYCMLELVVPDKTVIDDSAVPGDLVLSVHGLILETTFISSCAFLILARVPLSVFKGSIEPAFSTSRFRVINLAFAHSSCLEEALEFCFFVREVQCALSMTLVEGVNLALVRGSVAVRDVLNRQIKSGLLHTFLRLGHALLH